MTGIKEAGTIFYIAALWKSIGRAAMLAGLAALAVIRRRGHLFASLEPAPEIDGETPTLLIVEIEEHDCGLDRGRFAYRLDEAQTLHPLAAE